MKRSRLFGRIFLSLLLAAAGPLLGGAVVATGFLRNEMLRRMEEDLESKARLLQELLAGKLDTRSPKEIDALCKEAGHLSDTRITVVDLQGRVLADSSRDPATLDNHGSRPEIVDALKYGRGISIRRGDTAREEIMYVAVLVHGRGGTGAVVRTSTPVARIDGPLGSLYAWLLWIAIATVGLAGLVSYGLARGITRTLDAFKEGAGRFAGGELRHRLVVPDSEEFGQVAKAMNEMASRLQDRMDHLGRRHRELNALLSSMTEGVIAVDSEERIIMMNRAAAELFDVRPEGAEGRTLQEVIRNRGLQDFVRRALARGGTAEGEIVVWQEQERYLQANGRPLRGLSNEEPGVLVVLNDVTRLRRLEELRKDFAANVSHELRTPITLIKGFVETLLDRGDENPREARRFLRVIARQTDRLNAIIEDLLSLARIEKEEEGGGIPLEEGGLAPVLRGAVEKCRLAAAERSQGIELECEEGLRVRLNPRLLEQAVVNLIDNAVKYGPKGKPIRVRGRRGNGEVRVEVADEGPGIEAEHLPRLFERFYRVDRGRSRALGGTGLGLAIVKHIAIAHGGRVSVESRPGRGSTFTIHLPGS